MRISDWSSDVCSSDLALNELPAVPYRTLRWDTPNDSLGRFDLIIGSDILYERDHAERLSALLPRHAQRVCEVLITDPGRGNSATFTRALAAQDFVLVERRCRMDEGDMPRSEEHTSELQSLMRISYAVFCLKKKSKINQHLE